MVEGERERRPMAAALCPNPFSEISCSLYVPPLIYTESAFGLPSFYHQHYPHPPHCEQYVPRGQLQYVCISKSKSNTVTNSIGVGAAARGLCWNFFLSLNGPWLLKVSKSSGCMACCHNINTLEPKVFLGPIKMENNLENSPVRS